MTCRSDASSARSCPRRSIDKLDGAKLLLVQPVTPDDEPRGAPLLTIDSVGAGVGEHVLIVIEGKAAGQALGRKAAPVDAAIIGIIDQVDDVDLGGDRTDERRPTAASRSATRCADTRASCARRASASAPRPARGAATTRRRRAATNATTHLSHAMYLTLVNPGDACLIEPAVACNHCGFCQSHGH